MQRYGRMPQHLRLPAPLRNPSRRARGNGAPTPPTRAARSHAAQLQASIREPDSRPNQLTGIDPDRVFKFRSAGLLADASLRGEGLEVLGENAEWVYFVLMDDAARSHLDNTLGQYAATEDGSQFPGTKSLHDTLSLVDAIEPYGPEDRLDPTLADATTDPIDVNIRIWPSATTAEARGRIALVRSVIGSDSQRSSVLADDDDPETTIVVASLSRDALDLIAQTSVVESITPPLSITVTPSNVAQWTLPKDAPPPGGAPIGVLDDGLVTGNPLLDRVVQAEAAFPASYAWNPPGTHGVAVASLAAYFDFEDAVRGGQATGDTQPVLIARILEPNPTRPTEVGPPPGTVFERSVEDAIRWLHEQGARVINLSVCEQHAARAGSLPSPLTVVLDRLSAELDVLVVVAVGNIANDQMFETNVLGQHAATNYPAYLRLPDAAVAAPATAANVVAVSSIAHYDAPSQTGYAPIAAAGHPSPFGRTGVASRGRQFEKPDLSHWGGNWAWNNHLGTIHRLDAAITTIVASAQDNPQLEPGHNGTSFAAPRIAHVAARIMTAYPDASANLTRALLAMSARADPIDPGLIPADELKGFLGHGTPHADLATVSGGNRVVMIADSELDCNTTEIHRIAIPEEFATGRSRRRIRVALAYNPPVRRQRRDYTAGVMTLALLRAVDEHEALAIFQRQPTRQQRQANPALPYTALPQDRKRLNLEPSTPAIGRTTLVRTEWTGVLLDPKDGDEYFLAVAHSKATWPGLGEYETQRYGLAVEVVDEGRVTLPLYDLIQAKLRARAGVRATIGRP